ncbi:Protoheme IX farnesyltransferase [Methanolapillus millepedarum]|uniref:Protoheme IX farnesyltransferase n=1 Tax=Methanolapillus millepedarum TaxID=3028296 RepID=A0AA96ZVW5_9EURY|nr:Protoheme IX farnesyltransferase [Methanosarcinaceae archaeon Ac7]
MSVRVINLSLKNKIMPYITMLRPEIAFMDITLPASSAMLAYYFATGDLPNLWLLLLATIGGFFAITSSYVFNDCVDVDIDLINLPNRPLPSGQVSRRSAFIYATALALIAVFISFYMNPESFVVLLIALFIITLYSVFFKRKTPFSFIPVGLAYGLVPIGIWLAFAPAGILTPAVGPYFTGMASALADLKLTYLLPLPALFFGLMICMTDWGFTLAGVSRDVEGDRQKGAPTLPVTYGIPLTAKFILIIWVIGIVLSIAIGLSANLGPLYFIIALLSGFWMLLHCVKFIKNPTPELGGRLFVDGSNYRGVMFSAMILDILLLVFVDVYPTLLEFFGF